MRLNKGDSNCDNWFKTKFEAALKKGRGKYVKSANYDRSTCKNCNSGSGNRTACHRCLARRVWRGGSGDGDEGEETTSGPTDDGDNDEDRGIDEEPISFAPADQHAFNNLVSVIRLQKSLPTLYRFSVSESFHLRQGQPKIQGELHLFQNGSAHGRTDDEFL